MPLFWSSSSSSSSLSQKSKLNNEQPTEKNTNTNTTQKIEGFRFLQSLAETSENNNNNNNDDKGASSTKVSHGTLALTAFVATAFSSFLTASLLHAKNRKHKLERDLPARVHLNASIKGAQALGVATGLSLSLVSVVFASTHYAGLWEKEEVGKRIERALRSVPGGEAFKGPPSRKGEKVR
jgi:hypothetical protein